MGDSETVEASHGRWVKGQIGAYFAGSVSQLSS